jgi:ATP diphosphatase
MKQSRDITQLIAIMAALRTPGNGCPWDLEQTFETIAPFTIEEAYEVADAIARKDIPGLADELGDLLLQVVFHARMAEENGTFDFGDVVLAITRKMIRRHPHIFGDKKNLNADEVKALWHKIKAEERGERGNGIGVEGTLHGVPIALPALTRAEKLQAKAAAVGFDWPSIDNVKAKINEELKELEDAKNDKNASAEELGDLLFAITNLARHLGIDAEAALRGTNQKFERRFGEIEKALKERGRSPEKSNLEEMDELWNEAKASERRSKGV